MRRKSVALFTAIVPGVLALALSSTGCSDDDAPSTATDTGTASDTGAPVDGGGNDTGATDTGVSGDSTPVGDGGGDAPVGASATATIESKSGSMATGTATFEEMAGGKIRIRVTIKGAKPAGKHGMHVHETGDCTHDMATSAGGHFNPTMKMHGDPAKPEHHAGDLGNIVIDAAGDGTLDWSTSDMTVAAGALSLVGKAIILHALEDDLTPTANAGGRIGCGVIKK